MATLSKQTATEQQEFKPLSVKRNFSYMVAGDVIFNGCQWGILAIIAKLGNAEMVGRYALALVIISPIFLFVNLNLRSVQVTDYHRKHIFSEYVGLRTVATFVALVFIGLLLCVMHYDRETGLVIIMVTLLKIFDSTSDLIYGLMQQNERMDFIAVSRIIQGVTQLFLAYIVMKATSNIVSVITVLAIASGIVTALYDVRKAVFVIGGQAKTRREKAETTSPFRALIPSFNTKSLIPLFTLSLPLGIVAVLNLLNINIPRYFISHYSGLAELGIFTAMWSILHPIGMIAGSFMQSIFPMVARYYVEDINAYKKSLIKMVIIVLGCGIAGVLMAQFLGRTVLTVLFRPEYATHPDVFVVIMLAASLQYIASVISGFVSAARFFKPQPIIWVITILVNSAFCWFLVPKFGIKGAAWAYFGGCLTWMLGYMITIAFIINKKSQEDALLKAN